MKEEGGSVCVCVCVWHAKTYGDFVSQLGHLYDEGVCVCVCVCVWRTKTYGDFVSQLGHLYDEVFVLLWLELEQLLDNHHTLPYNSLCIT